MTAKALILSLRYVFVFRKPELRRFNCVNLVIDGKLLLFIAWDGRRVGYVNIAKTKHRFYKKQGAHLLKLPDNLSKTKIVIGNLWTKTVLRIDLIKTRLDDKTMKFLIDDLNNMEKMKVDKKLKPLFPERKKIGLVMGEGMTEIKVNIDLRKSVISFKKKIELNSKLFEYKTQNPSI
ncbi:MAG: hypothetical protein WDO19_24475 [Bacteroidota bacterium]